MQAIGTASSHVRHVPLRVQDETASCCSRSAHESQTTASPSLTNDSLSLIKEAKTTIVGLNSRYENESIAPHPPDPSSAGKANRECKGRACSDEICEA